jgi:hypothetical protein
MAQLKDRDLFDSLYRGYPCGFLLHWETGRPHAVQRLK